MIKKTILLISSVLICMILGNSITYLYLVAQGIEINVEDFSNLEELVRSNHLSVNGLKVMLLINSLITFVGGAYLFLKLNRIKDIRGYLGLQKEVGIIHLVLMFGLLYTSLPLASALGMLSSKISFPEWMNSMDTDSINTLSFLLEMDSPLDFIITLLLVSIVAGFGEELIFRGIIQRELQSIIMPSWIAIIVTAFLFSAIHLQPTAFLTKFVIGLVLGYVYWLSGNLWYSIFLHTINNGLPLLLLYLNPVGLGKEIDKSAEMPIPWGGVMISTILAIYITFMLYKKIKIERKA